ncbi:MAG: acetylornithine transaminase [Thiotrichaceae bacterium]|nr:acetylornithine transaminase [Thiotrichaceae bacterium]
MTLMPSLMSNYSRLPVSFVRGEGACLWDTEGARYLDALSGIAVCGLGHAHPAITRAICEQASQLLHTSNVYGIANQQALADKLVQLSGMENVFFCNSGTEANEAAIKLARLYGNQRGISVPTIVVMEGAFHGRTLAALTATGNRKAQAGFAPLVEGFIRIPYNDIDALHTLATQQGNNIVAVLVEPVQGEGGVVIPAADYLNQIRSICDQNEWLMMLDEIQTGIGRTGKWFAFQHNGILPDVMTLAKGLGNGIPVGACLARGKAAGLFQAGSHGSTFGGNPFACKVALTVLETIENENLLPRVQALSARFMQGLQTALADVAAVKVIRNHGLLIGIELDRPCGELVKLALAEHLLINVTAEKVIRLLPPFILSDAQVDEIVDTLSRLIKNFTH